MAYVSECGASALARAMRLYGCYQQESPARVERRRTDRIIPPVLVDLGDLCGLIYRSDRGPSRTPRSYVHFFERPPRLVADPDGSRLFILGGCYRVTRRGIEG